MICMGKFAGWPTLPSSNFFHTNLLIQAQLQTDARFDVLMLRSWNFACLRSFYALSDYGTKKLIGDDFLVTWSRDQLLQKAYCYKILRKVCHPANFPIQIISGHAQKCVNFQWNDAPSYLWTAFSVRARVCARVSRAVRQRRLVSGNAHST